MSDRARPGHGHPRGRSLRDRLRRAAACVAVVLGVSACEEHHFEPPDREEQVEEAERLYSPALFDTVTWASDSARIMRGNSVYSSECRQCHGPLGRGGTAYAAEHDLDVPSLVAEEWALAGDFDGVRRRIFTGHAEGMPTWGVAGISPREIDAVAYYVVEQLRPDVLEGGASVPRGGGDGSDGSGAEGGGGAGTAPSAGGAPGAR